MSWIGAYVCLALMFAAGVAVLVDTRHAGNAVAGARGWTYIVLGGLLWPVLAVGLAQLGAVMLAARVARNYPRARPSSGFRGAVGSVNPD